MPTYNFRNKVTGEEWTDEMRISQMEEILEQNPDVDVVPTAVGYADSWRLGVSKNSEGFKDVLRDIKRRNPGSTIDV